MLRIDEIRELIKAIDESNIEELKYEQDGTKLVLRKERSMEVDRTSIERSVKTVEPKEYSIPVEAKPQKLLEETAEQVKSETVNNREALHTITSPMVGTFYSSPSPDKAAYVKIGDKVKNETVVCIIEAMKLMNEIEAEVKGSIVEVLVENGQLVEYGQELFIVKPE